MKKEIGVETGAQMWLESNGDIGNVTSVKSPLLAKHGVSQCSQVFCEISD